MIRTLAEFGCSVKFQEDGKFFPTKNTPAIYRIKHNEATGHIYSQLELNFGGMNYQITLPRSELLKCLSISKLLRRIEPVRVENKTIRIFDDNIRAVKKLMEIESITRADEQLSSELEW